METSSPIQVGKGRGPQFKILGRYYRYLDPVIHDPLIRGYFEIVATILLIAFFVAVAIRPTSATIARLYKEIADMEKVEEALTKKFADLVAAQENYSQVSSKIPALERALPKKPAVDQLVIDLEEIVTANDLAMEGLTIGPTGLTPDAWKSNQKYREGEASPLGFGFSTTTDFAGGEKLLRDLIAGKRLVAIDSVKFSFEGEESAAALEVSYTGSAYFLP